MVATGDRPLPGVADVVQGWLQTLTHNAHTDVPPLILQPNPSRLRSALTQPLDSSASRCSASCARFEHGGGFTHPNGANRMQVDIVFAYAHV
jgi:hypothetical protein